MKRSEFELDQLKKKVSDQRSEVKRRLDSDWRLVSFALAIIVLLAVGAFGGMYLGSESHSTV